MPRYTNINQLPVPRSNEPPNVQTATHPLIMAAERRMLLRANTYAQMLGRRPTPTEGEISCVLDQALTFLTFVDGQWRSTMSNWYFPSALVSNVTGTNFVTIARLRLIPNSIYRFDGVIEFFSPDDSVQFRLGGDALRIEANVGGNLVSSTTTTYTFGPEEFHQDAIFFTGAIRTSPNDSDIDTMFEIEARKTADTGDDLEIDFLQFKFYRIGAWSGV